LQKIPIEGHFYNLQNCNNLAVCIDCNLQNCNNLAVFVNLQKIPIAIYKNGQIIAILQIMKIPLYRDVLQFIKTATLLQIMIQLVHG
jgi:hypothetical protein